MKSNFSQLASSTLIYGVGNMLTRFLNLLLLPFFTAYLSPADYGVLAILALLTMVVQPVFSLGFGAAMGPSYFAGNDEVRKSQTVWTAFFILMVSTSTLTIFAWVISEPISQLLLLPKENSLLVSLSLTGCAFSILTTPFTLRVQFNEQAKLFVILTITNGLITITLSIATVIFWRLGVKGMVIAQAVSYVFTFILFAVLAIKETSVKFDKQVGKQLLHLGLPIIPSFVFLFVLMQSNRYILQWFEGLELVGIYSIGFNFGSVMSICVGAFTTAWYPFFMGFMEKQQLASHLFGKITTYYFMGFGLLCALFFFYAKPLVHWVTQPVFHDAYIVIGFVAVAHFFLGVFNLLLPSCYFQKDLKIVFLAQGAAAICSLPINYLLIKLFGTVGAALGLAISHLFLALIFYGINISRANFFQVIYEIRRIVAVSLFLAFLSLCSFWIPTDAITVEIGYASVLTLTAALGLVVLASKTEMAVIWKRVRLAK